MAYTYPLQTEVEPVKYPEVTTTAIQLREPVCGECADSPVWIVPDPESTPEQPIYRLMSVDGGPNGEFEWIMARLKGSRR